MAFSLLTATYTGGPRVFQLSFALGYLERSDIQVNVLGELDAMGNPINRAFTFNSATEIVVTDTIPANSTVRISRTVDKEALPVDFSAPGSATREALDTNARYLIMAVHEALDGRLDGSVENLEEVSSQVLTARSQAATSATAAAASATAAASSASTVTASATAAANSATAASTSETNAAASATTAMSGLTSITAIGDAATASATAAATSATTAAASETAASASATTATTQASAASTSASAAQTSANDAASSAALVPGAATQAQAVAGTDNSTFMTPLRTQEAIAANPTGWTYSASQTLTIGSNTELLNGIPTGVNEVRVIFSEITCPTSARFFINLGVNNAVYTAGYTTRYTRSFSNAVTQSPTSGETTGFRAGGWSTAETISGMLTLMRLGNTNTWQGDLNGNAQRGSFTASGQVVLPSALTSIAILSDSPIRTFVAGGSFIVGWRT